MSSILGALARPSMRSTTRLPFTSTSVGTARDVEALGELGLFVDVDTHHAETRALLPREVREQALHPACGARTLGREEDEQRLRIVAH